MSMAFDPVEYVDKLKSADVSEAQAWIQAQAFMTFINAQEEKERHNLATKGDLRETELRLQKEIEQVRKEIKDTELQLQKEISLNRKEIKETELRLQKEIRETELRMIKEISRGKIFLLSCMLAGWASLVTIMAKGFNWLGF